MMKNETEGIEKNIEKLIVRIARIENFLKEEYKDFPDNQIHKKLNYIKEEINNFKKEFDNSKTSPLQVAFVGSYSAGKSSCINTLIGDNLLPTDDCPTSKIINILKYGKMENIIAITKSGEEKSLSREEYKKLTISQNNKNIDKIIISLPIEFLKDINIIDTPGFFNPQGQGDDERTKKYVITSDYLMWVVDVTMGSLPKSEKDILSKIRKNNISLIANKVDQKERTAFFKIYNKLSSQYNFDRKFAFSSKYIYDKNTSNYNNEENKNILIRFLNELHGSKSKLKGALLKEKYKKLTDDIIPTNLKYIWKELEDRINDIEISNEKRADTIKKIINEYQYKIIDSIKKSIRKNWINNMTKKQWNYANIKSVYENVRVLGQLRSDNKYECINDNYEIMKLEINNYLAEAFSNSGIEIAEILNRYEEIINNIKTLQIRSLDSYLSTFFLYFFPTDWLSKNLIDYLIINKFHHFGARTRNEWLNGRSKIGKKHQKGFSSNAEIIDYIRELISKFYIDSYCKVLASIYLKINDELTTPYLNNYLKCKNLIQKLINNLTNEKEARQ